MLKVEVVMAKKISDSEIESIMLKADTLSEDLGMLIEGLRVGFIPSAKAKELQRVLSFLIRDSSQCFLSLNSSVRQ